MRYTETGQVHVQVEPFLSDVHDVSIQSRVRTGAMLQSNAGTGELPAQGWLGFVVHDTGPGLPALAADRLKSAAASFESSGDGIGIGLIVIRDVLQQLGGRIDVRSRGAADHEGQGTSYNVGGPATRTIDGAVGIGTAVLTEALSVLVVDDLSDVWEALRDV